MVVKTPAGYATPLADAIDAAGLADVAGTVAGENTIFVAPRDGATPEPASRSCCVTTWTADAQ